MPGSTYTLAVERSTPAGSWALFEGASLRLARTFAAGDPRTPDWIVELLSGLARQGVAPESVQQLVVGTGPGSFSGIRAAIALLQGMALPRGLPVYGLSSAAVLARQAALAVGHDTMAVVGDARRQHLWCAVFRLLPDGRLVQARTGRRPTHDGDDCCLVDEANLAAAIPASARVVTPEWERLGERLTRMLAPGLLIPGPVTPTAASLGALLHVDREAARRDPVPVYLHPAVA